MISKLFYNNKYVIKITHKNVNKKKKKKKKKN